jgi:16S rRNA (adenine1518-N6/adenine1519-N6)-dimethyltransferase
MPDPRPVLRLLGIEPKKSLGQNFMVEPAALARLVEAADIGPEDAVLEIGAGLGALTDRLAERARRVVALEIDGRFIAWLKGRYAHQPQVEVVQADVLETDLPALLGADAACYRVVANLPYYITSPVLRYLLECPAPPCLIVVTVQLEVARRLAAQPGQMSLLAVSAQFYGRVQVVGHIKAGAFYPRPEVDSAIVRIEPHAGGPPLLPPAREEFFHVVRAGFSQPRKQLRNSLASGLRLKTEDVVNWLTAAGIDPQRRAETLSLEEWIRLTMRSHRGLIPG